MEFNLFRTIILFILVKSYFDNNNSTETILSDIALEDDSSEDCKGYIYRTLRFPKKWKATKRGRLLILKSM